jgi:hypothetical protein
MFAFVKNLLGLESESESEDSDSEFSSINSSDYENDSDNESVQEEEVGEDQADFQRGDRCSFCPRGQKKWSNAVVIKYRYPNQFTLKIEGSGRICLGIKREQLHLPIKVIPINTSITYKVGEMVDVVRKKTVRTVEDAKKELEKELNEAKKKKKGSANNSFGNGNGNVHFNNDAWTQGQIVKVTNDAIDPLAPPWYKIRFEGGIVDREVKECNVRKVFRKGDLVEVRHEGWAEYYRGRIVKKMGRRNYNIVVQEDGELIENVDRVRLRSVGDMTDHVGKFVSDQYRATRRKYVNFIKSGNFRGMLRMVEEDGIHPDHEDPMTGRNGLIKACLTNQARRAKDFVDIGADVDYETMSGLTPLIACAEKGSIKVAKMILLDPWNRPLADPWRKNKLGQTAMDMAKQHKRTRFVEFLDALTSKDDYEYARKHNLELTIVDPNAAKKKMEELAKKLENRLKYDGFKRNQAAKLIQKIFRGILDRKHFKLKMDKEKKDRLEADRKEYLRKGK